MSQSERLRALVARWRVYSPDDAKGDDGRYNEPVGTYMHGQRIACADELEAALATGKVTVVCGCHDCATHGMIIRQWEHMQKPSPASVDIRQMAAKAPRPPLVYADELRSNFVEELNLYEKGKF